MKLTSYLIIRLSLLFASGYGVFDQMGIFNGTFNGKQLIYYTILSNLLIFITYFYLNGKFFYQLIRQRAVQYVNISSNLMGALVLMITVTGLVYHLILVPQLFNQPGLSTFSNFLVHSYVPLVTVIDWLFLVKISNLAKITPTRWLAIPVIYWLIAVWYASLKQPLFNTGKYYAYFFIDHYQLGWFNVFVNLMGLLMLFLVLGFALKSMKLIQLWLDNSRPSQKSSS